MGVVACVIALGMFAIFMQPPIKSPPAFNTQ